MDRTDILFTLIGAIVIALIAFVFVYYFWVILGITILIGLGIIIIMILIPIIFFVISFIALFYYMAAKKPKIEPGQYSLEQEKGKGE